MAAYETDKVSSRQQLLERKRQQTLQAFQQSLGTQYQELRQKGEIVINPQYVF
jgi:hypothetical protein